MPKKFTPTSKAKLQKLDQLVEMGVPTTDKQPTGTSTASLRVERVNNGYRLRKDYVKKVSVLSSLTGMKKFEIVEAALALYFDKHQEVLDKLEV